MSGLTPSAEVILEPSTTKEMTREDLIQLAQDGVKALLLLQGKGTAIVSRENPRRCASYTLVAGGKRN